MSSGGDNDDGSGVPPPNAPLVPPPNMPYVGPVGYPPGMWGSYAPTGPNGKLEGGAYYHPVFALTPVGGQPPPGVEGEGAGGDSEAPHFPVGFYPATFISYPPYPPYAIHQGHGTPHGFHYAYPPPPGMFPPRPPNASHGSLTNEQGASSSSTEANVKNASGTSATVEGDKSSKGVDADSPVNGKAKVTESQVMSSAVKGTE